jgi:hypothetical protein
MYNKEIYQKYKETKKNYYLRNRERILEKNKQRVKCECGVEVCKYVLPKHQKTWTHRYFLGNLNEFELLENKISV